MTRKQATRVMEWCVKQLGLSHWTIKFWYQDNTPSVFDDLDARVKGSTNQYTDYRQAEIWVSPSRNKGEFETISTICHEAIHVFVADHGLSGNEDLMEHVAVQLESLLAKAYMKGVR